ncbi:MAG: glycosyltransferase family 2 protein [Planctomycetota bacterium]|jgi:glycosyltransferase involved in cell wall biosynthesis
MAGNTQANITALIFSKDRAMQLRAVIESLLLHCRDHSLVELKVFYKASSRLHRGQYDKLRDEFCDVCFIEELNFREQVLGLIDETEYVMFLVDDNLFVRDFMLGRAVKVMAGNGDALGFSLRLGANTAYCYAHDTYQDAPAFRHINDETMKYDWTHAEYDFGYPLELSSSIYRSAEILPLLRRLNFANPNTLEGAMAANAHLYREAKSSLLCFEQSVTFCAPVNMVQTVWQNRVGSNQSYSAERLAQMFEEGGRIDVERYSGFVPNSCHQEVELYFDHCHRPSAPEPDRRDSTPGFSVIMANYNNGRYIGEAIESVIDQKFTDWELIIVEDCSTDDSEAVIERYLGDERIRLIRHEANRGYTAALKTGISEVHSEYFGILDSDDALASHALETMRRWHVNLPDCGLIYSQFAFCDENLNRKKIGFCSELPPGRTSLDVNAASHFKTFKLRDYLKTAGYDESILYAEDVDIVYKMEEVAGMKFIDQCLYMYRETPNSICRSSEKINVAIMSRVKARINALKRRSAARLGGNNDDFYRLFAESVQEARSVHPDVEQYFDILARLYRSGMLANINWPEGAEKWGTPQAVLWLAANVDIQFDKLFELLSKHKTAEPPGDEPKPLVSVEMAAYNAERFIGRAIESVLAQTYDNFELVIVDDGSTDGTGDIVASCTDPRIRYIRTSHKNCAAARNRVIVEAKGEYLLCVDSDDYIAPDYIEKIVAWALKHPEIDYFYPSRLQPVDASGAATGEQWEYMDFSDNRVLPSFLFDKGYGPIPNPGSLKRRALFERTGGYDDVDSVEDFVFLCKNALKIRFMRVDAHTDYFYTRLPSGSSHNFEARNRIMADTLNKMVSLYGADVLWPQITGISDAAEKQQRYYDYLMRTFHRHAAGSMVENGEYFRECGDYYRNKLHEAGESCETVVSTEGL